MCMAVEPILVQRAGLPTVSLTIDGVVDLPQANSLFQTVGAPIGSQPTAPPDNVILMPAARWHATFDPLATSRPDLVGTQIHVARDTALPSDPAAAFTQVSAAAHIILQRVKRVWRVVLGMRSGHHRAIGPQQRYALAVEVMVRDDVEPGVFLHRDRMIAGAIFDRAKLVWTECTGAELLS